MAYVTRTHGERLYAKFQPPQSNGLKACSVETRVQNKDYVHIEFEDSRFDFFTIATP